MKTPKTEKSVWFKYDSISYWHLFYHMFSLTSRTFYSSKKFEKQNVSLVCVWHFLICKSKPKDTLIRRVGSFRITKYTCFYENDLITIGRSGFFKPFEFRWGRLRLLVFFVGFWQSNVFLDIYSQRSNIWPCY